MVACVLLLRNKFKCLLITLYIYFVIHVCWLLERKLLATGVILLKEINVFDVKETMVHIIKDWL